MGVDGRQPDLFLHARDRGIATKLFLHGPELKEDAFGGFRNISPSVLEIRPRWLEWIYSYGFDSYFPYVKTQGVVKWGFNGGSFEDIPLGAFILSIVEILVETDLEETNGSSSNN